MPGPSTLAVHAGERPDAASGAVNTPIVASTTYRYPEAADGSRSRYIYSRYDNPTVEALEGKVTALEGAQGARSLAFASGLGAEQAIFSLLRPGDAVVVQQGIYGGTTALLADHVAPLGIEVVEVGVEAPAPGDLPPNARIVWCESLTNPLLRVSDVPAWADAAHAAGALLVVDATFASPLLQRPLSLGADVVLHSATKYLGGHSDVTAGVLSCDDADLCESLWKARRNQGATLDPHAADRVIRGMKTLALRMRAHCDNARVLADAASEHPAVAAVHFPGRPGHPDHDRAGRLLDGFGGMLTLDLGSLEAAVAFRRAVRVVTPAASLGGVESLVSLPLETSHTYAPGPERRAQGVTDGLVRISVGIEDAEDLLADLRFALDAAGATGTAGTATPASSGGGGEQAMT